MLKRNFYNPYDEINKIAENLYQSDEVGSKNKTELDQLGITHILSVGEGFKQEFSDKTYKIIDIYDEPGENLDKHFEDVINFVDGAINGGGKVLIHCWAGISRSSTCTCTYLMWKNRISVEEALEILKKGRECAQPNTGFMQQLKKFEGSLEK